MGEALFLECNEFARLTMQLLTPTYGSVPSKDVFEQLQAPAIYNACLAVIRNAGTVSSQQKDQAASELYANFTIDGWFQWLTDNEMPAPTWLTNEMMGRSTINGEI